jgi:hypothetical protein
MHGVGAADIRGAGFGQAEIADFAGGDEFGDGAGDILDRHGTVDAVLIEQVDVIGPQPLQRAFHGLADLIGMAVILPSSIRKPNLVAMVTWSRLSRSARPSNSSFLKGP